MINGTEDVFYRDVKNSEEVMLTSNKNVRARVVSERYFSIADLTYYSFEKVLTNRHFKLYGDDLDSIYQAFEDEKEKHPEMETTVEKVDSLTQIQHQNWKQPQRTIVINFSVETASFSAQEQKEKVLNIFDQISSRTKDTSVVIILPPRLPVNISEKVIEHSPLIMFNLRKIVLEQIRKSKQKKIAVVDFWQFTNSIKNLDRFAGKALKTVDLYVNLLENLMTMQICPECVDAVDTVLEYVDYEEDTSDSTLKTSSPITCTDSEMRT